MRKIFVYSDTLLQGFLDDYIRETQKFFKTTKLEMEHLNKKFILKGNEYELIGRVDECDVCCRKDDGTIWAIERTVVQQLLVGESKIVYKGERKLIKIEKKSEEDLTDTRGLQYPVDQFDEIDRLDNLSIEIPDEDER